MKNSKSFFLTPSIHVYAPPESYKLQMMCVVHTQVVHTCQFFAAPFMGCYCKTSHTNLCVCWGGGGGAAK